MKPDFLFVLEQSLGHAVHGANLEGALAVEPDMSSRVIRIGPGRESRPFLRNWSVEASTLTRAELRRSLAVRRPDAMYIHTQVTALLAGRFMRSVPTVVSMDATPLNFDALGAGYGHDRQSAPAERAKWALNRRVFRTAGALVTWSAWAADSLVADYRIARDKVHVIRPGVDIRRFMTAGARVTAADGPVRLLFVGGDFTRKGGYDLLEAVSRVRGPIELDIATSAPVRDLPPDLVARVHTGLRPNSPELLDLYRRADLFVLPSRGECYGLVLSEALASSLPVVACDVGAVHELVVHGETGLLVPPAAPAALANALQTLVDRPDLRRDMGRRGVELAATEHDAALNARRIFALMRRISVFPEPAEITDR